MEKQVFTESYLQSLLDFEKALDGKGQGLLTLGAIVEKVKEFEETAEKLVIKHNDPKKAGAQAEH